MFFFILLSIFKTVLKLCPVSPMHVFLQGKFLEVCFVSLNGLCFLHSLQALWYLVKIYHLIKPPLLPFFADWLHAEKDLLAGHVLRLGINQCEGAWSSQQFFGHVSFWACVCVCFWFPLYTVIFKFLIFTENLTPDSSLGLRCCCVPQLVLSFPGHIQANSLLVDSIALPASSHG